MNTRIEVSLRTFLCTSLVLAGYCLAVARAADTGVTAEAREALSESRFKERLESLREQRTDADRLHHARRMMEGHLLSSAQVKAMCACLGDDNARLELASEAYPWVVDPEHFYDVYDAFTTFSRVMRLHDRIGQVQRPPRGPRVAVLQPLPDGEFKDILNALRKEPFDNTRLRLAKQVLSSSRGNFLSRQVKEMVECFSFDDGRLDLAKYAYDYTLDREKYFLVSDAFHFPSSRDNLARHIESRNQAR